ncbi:MAG: methyltransferase domain-containing protein, partial [Actinomycetota bacterium]|nr:methyltransferase domain-containing protein [Actinomycetota bacterium]
MGDEVHGRSSSGSLDDLKAKLGGFGLDDDDAAAWARSGLPQDAFDDWLTDRVARRPQGLRAREIYTDPAMHEFARRAILSALALDSHDHLLEIGCGGGILLRDALATGARVTGVDHSPEMVALARENAPRATVVESDAASLPFADATFTKAALAVVFFFLPDPVRVLRECARVLVPGGRVAVYTTGPELRGTPAAPEPIASRGYFYRDD